MLATYSAHKRNDDVTHLPPPTPTNTHHLYPPPHIQRQPSFCQSRVQYILPLHKRTFSDILSDLVDDSLSATVMFAKGCPFSFISFQLPHLLIVFDQYHLNILSLYLPLQKINSVSHFSSRLLVFVF